MPDQPDLPASVPEGAPDACGSSIASAPLHPALRRCYEILDRVGRAADAAGLPDPPPEHPLFALLGGPPEGATEAEG